MFVSLEDVDVSKAKEEQLKKILKENREIEEDIASLRLIGDATSRLHCPHKDLDDLARQMISQLNRQLAERQNSDPQQSAYLDLVVGGSSSGGGGGGGSGGGDGGGGGSGGGGETVSLIFADAERRSHWEEAFNDVKQKLSEALFKYIVVSTACLVIVVLLSSSHGGQEGSP